MTHFLNFSVIFLFASSKIGVLQNAEQLRSDDSTVFDDTNKRSFIEKSDQGQFYGIADGYTSQISGSGNANNQASQSYSETSGQSRQFYYSSLNTQLYLGSASTLNEPIGQNAQVYYSADIQNQAAQQNDQKRDSIVHQGGRNDFSSTGSNDKNVSVEKHFGLVDSNQKDASENIQNANQYRKSLPTIYNGDSSMIHVRDENPIIAPNDSGKIEIIFPPTITYDEKMISECILTEE
jgi:hypothetical protein